MPNPHQRPRSAVLAQSSQKDRQRYIRAFAELEQQFRDSFQCARKIFPDLQYYRAMIASPLELLTFIEQQDLAVLGGQGRSYVGFLRALGPNRKLTRQDLARACAFNLIPAAASLVINAAERGFLADLPQLMVAVAAGETPRDDTERREFWNETVLAGLKKERASEFQSKCPMSWRPAYERIVACKLLGTLVKQDEDTARGEPAAGNLKTKMDWQIAAKKTLVILRRHRFPGVRALAKLVGCSPSTMLKALENDLELVAKYGAYKDSLPCGSTHSLSQAALNDAVQSRESNPAEEITRRSVFADPKRNDELIESLLDTVKPSQRDETRAALEKEDPEKLRELAKVYGENQHDPQRTHRGR